jgi:predicted nuclease with TOPRIM domain
LPEGAKIQADSDVGNVYQSEVNNASRFSNMNINLGYRYNILWSSFRPVTWSGVSSAILCAVIFLLSRRAKPAAVAIAPVATEALRNFVDSYEERMRIVTELRSMGRQVRRGRLSRRRYRARRASLDNRLRRLDKELTDLRSKISDAGRTYADLVQRLEVAETELETVDQNIRRVEVRYRRGEISAEARQRLLDEYSSRRDRAESTVSQVTLRLREEL